MSDRRALLDGLYRVLAEQARRQGGPRLIGSATGRDDWPTHGVYFIFEPGEVREDGVTPRVVRVGTHALSATSRSTLWGRLRTHRGRLGGSNPGGGNHRGSIFRLHVGTALLNKNGTSHDTWGKGSSASREVRDGEVQIEREVTAHIGAMTVVCIGVSDRLRRATIERECIALLSNHDREPLDPPSPSWLGHHADRDLVRASGLWNVGHVTAGPPAASPLAGLTG